MQFNDPWFIVAFLPATLALFYVSGLRSRRLALGILTVASLGFYAWGSVEATAVLVGSGIANYVSARWMLRLPAGFARRSLLWVGVAANLALLGIFKYRGFFVENLNAAAGTRFQVVALLLPLGISFTTFRMVAFLVDVYRGKAPAFGPLDFALFSTFFASMASGPITRAQEMIPQFAKLSARFDAKGFTEGASIFIVGLAKKVLLADQLATVADPVFATYADGARMGLIHTWVGVLAYSLQIYYDFSGYSEMALGLAKMVNLKLPVNFNAPYKANSIIGFWTRWHISLSRFLRDYVFLSIASPFRTAGRLAGLMATMLLAGLWHGAQWTFVVWGGMHGLFLVVNHAWRELHERFPRAFDAVNSKRMRTVGRFVTFAAVTLAWVVFRSPDLTTALGVFRGLVGAGPGGRAPELWGQTGAIAPILGVASVIVLAVKAPDTMAVFSAAEPCFESLPIVRTRWRWRLDRRSAVAVGLLVFMVVHAFAEAQAGTGFVYSNF